MEIKSGFIFIYHSDVGGCAEWSAAASSPAYLHVGAGFGNFTDSAAHAESSRGIFKEEALLVEGRLRDPRPRRGRDIHA
jgi:hypothetical protein